MQIETLKDVLHWTTEFHDQLSQCLAHCADKNLSDRATLLLNYLSRHEHKLKELVREFEISTGTNVLNTWCLEYLERKPIVQHRHCDEPFSALDTRQIMEVIIEQHAQVLELYRYLRSRAVVASVKEALDSLLAMEEHEAMVMSQGANWLEDM